MKTSIKSLALALSLGVATLSPSLSVASDVKAPATVSYQSSVYSTSDGKLAIALNKQTGGAVDIRLKNKEGLVLFNQHISKNERQSRVRLNLSELPDGVYQVEITNGVDTKTHTLTLTTEQPQTPSRVVTMN